MGEGDKGVRSERFASTQVDNKHIVNLNCLLLLLSVVNIRAKYAVAKALAYAAGLEITFR